MSKWKDSDAWSSWVCAHGDCGCEHDDPDTVSVTSCANGHTNYLEPPHPKSRHRRAYATTKERAKDIREHNAIVTMWNDAIRAGHKAIVKSGRKPML